jgi:hypothetical protein
VPATTPALIPALQPGLIAVFRDGGQELRVYSVACNGALVGSVDHYVVAW